MHVSIFERCPLCDCQNLKLFYEYSQFSLLECEGCKLVFQDLKNSFDANSLVSEIYDGNWVKMRERLSESAFQHASFESALVRSSFPNKGSILEIGSGTGEFLFLMKESGWQTRGFEPSSASCRYAKETFGMDLINGLFSASLVPDGELYDAVVFWHVFEHVPNPVDFLLQARSVLKPGGSMYFSVPNRRSFTNRLKGFNSAIFTESDHVFHYSVEHLPVVLQKASMHATALFSRQSLERHFLDFQMVASIPEFMQTDFKGQMSLMAQLEGSFQGHELFCVARAI